MDRVSQFLGSLIRSPGSLSRTEESGALEEELAVWSFQSEVKSLSCVQLFVSPRTVAYQAPPSMGSFQARIQEWVAISFSRRYSQTRDWTQVSGIVGRRFTIWATREVQGGEKDKLFSYIP